MLIKPANGKYNSAPVMTADIACSGTAKSLAIVNSEGLVKRLI